MFKWQNISFFQIFRAILPNQLIWTYLAYLDGACLCLSKMHRYSIVRKDQILLKQYFRILSLTAARYNFICFVKITSINNWRKTQLNLICLSISSTVSWMNKQKIRFSPYTWLDIINNLCSSCTRTFAPGRFDFVFSHIWTKCGDLYKHKPVNLYIQIKYRISWNKHPWRLFTFEAFKVLLL